MQNQMMIPEAMLERLKAIEEKHEDILKIAKGMKEIQAMWNDLQALVDANDEKLNSIDQNIQSAKANVKEGVVALESAEQYQLSAMKKQQAMMCCVIITSAVVIAYF